MLNRVGCAVTRNSFRCALTLFEYGMELKLVEVPAVRLRLRYSAVVSMNPPSVTVTPPRRKVGLFRSTEVVVTEAGLALASELAFGFGVPSEKPLPPCCGPCA